MYVVLLILQMSYRKKERKKEACLTDGYWGRNLFCPAIVRCSFGRWRGCVFTVTGAHLGGWDRGGCIVLLLEIAFASPLASSSIPEVYVDWSMERALAFCWFSAYWYFFKAVVLQTHWVQRLCADEWKKKCALINFCWGLVIGYKSEFHHVDQQSSANSSL